LNSAGEDFWRRYHEFRRARHTETRPEDPIAPDDVERRRLVDQLRYEINDSYEVVSGGRMVAFLRTAVTRPGAPGYEENRQFLWCYGAVLEPYRRQGLGRRLLPLVLDVMDRHGCTFITFESDEDSGHAFIKWLGAPQKGQGAENRLRIADVDWAMVGRWIEEGEKRNPQTKLERYDGPMPDAMLDQYAAQLALLLNTMPWDDLEHGPIVVTADMLRHMYESHAATGERLYTVLTREPDGVISGITDVTWAPHRREIIEQMFTGVLPSARGRGIGKWIKASMLRRMHEMYPDVKWIATGNADSNGPMLAINHRLGFKRHRWGAEYQLSRDAFAERLKALKL